MRQQGQPGRQGQPLSVCRSLLLLLLLSFTRHHHSFNESNSIQSENRWAPKLASTYTFTYVFVLLLLPIQPKSVINFYLLIRIHQLMWRSKAIIW